MVPYTHPTYVEDPPPQTTHSREMLAPPLGRPEDRACWGRCCRNRGRVKEHRRRYRDRRRRGYGFGVLGKGRDDHYVRARGKEETD
jgi:hypothetical protein